MKLVNPKNGEEFTSPFKSHIDAHAAMTAKQEAGDFDKSPFATSIWKNTAIISKKQQGSPAQLYWMHRLAADEPKPEVKPTRKFDLAGLVSLLTTAKGNGLKFPRLVLTTKKGLQVKVHIAGDKSKHKGAVQIASTTFPGPYYGKVMPNGDFFPGKDMRPDVEGLLVDMAHNPLRTAGEQGKLTGHCCFCNKKLDDTRSTTLGYGPVCAKKFGLAHGSKAARRKTEKNMTSGLRAKGELFDPATIENKPRRVIRRRISKA